jgi:hypothetical protein
MTVYDRLGLTFDTNRFGSAQTLAPSASNTLNLIANTSPLKPWQATDLVNGPAVRTNYFQNPTASNVSSMLASASSLHDLATTANDFVTVAYASNLTIELNKFKSHTDNISGVTVSNSQGIPSLNSAQNIGQLNMLTLSKSDGVSNTVPILGSFTSLFIPDILQANTIQLALYTTEYAGSIITVTDPETGNTSMSSNLSNNEIANIQNYILSTTSILYNQRMQDWTFYQNSSQMNQDVSFLQQFNSMGGTMTYLVQNVVGTPSLIEKLNSANN